MTRNRIIDISIEVFIGLVMTSSVAILSGIRSDLTEIKVQMSTYVERSTHHELEIKEARDWLKNQDQRLRGIETEMATIKKK